jgi:hypothetical protein
MELQFIFAFIASGIASSILFYILVDGFYWKPARAVFVAPFASIIIPVASVTILLWGVSRILLDGQLRFLYSSRSRKA